MKLQRGHAGYGFAAPDGRRWQGDVMRFMPERHEVLSLSAVWLMWPALNLTVWMMLRLISEIDMFVALPARLAIQMSEWNRLCIPSAIGTACIVVVTRFAPNPDVKRLLYHFVTLVAFLFTSAVMLGLVSIAYDLTCSSRHGMVPRM